MYSEGWELLKDIYKQLRHAATEADWSGDYETADLLMQQARRVLARIELGETYEVPF